MLPRPRLPRSPRRSAARPSAAALVASAALATLAACGGDKPTEPPKPTLASLAIEQKLDTLSELASRQLSVAGTDSKGQPMPVPGTLAWSSSDTSVVVVDAAGLVTAVQPGAASVTVRSGAVSASVPLRVVGVPVRDLTVRLVGAVAVDTLMVGTSATIVAEARDVNGRLLRGRKVDVAVTDSARASVDASGRIAGLTVGYLTVVARVDTVERRPLLVVRPPYAAKMTLRLADPKKLGDTTWVGLRDSAVVTFSDSAGQPLPPSPFRPVSYTSDDPKVASVDFTGRVTLVGPGTATIRATGEKLVGARSVVVVRAPVTSVLAAPDTVRVSPGAVSQIRPILVDGGGLRVTSLGGHTLAFQSLAPSVATVDAQGNVTGVSAGTAQVRITSDRATGVLPVRVVPPAGDRAFHITLRFVGPAPAPYVKDAFETAAKRWEGVIRETTGIYTDTLVKNSCSNPEATHEEQITDIVIYADVDSIDGPSNILGQAGPCYIKQVPSGRWMSTVGEMVFDSADMNLMQTRGLLVNVITHEMGHVLGIGTMWAARYNNNSALANQRGFDPRYFGSGGIGAAAGMGFTGVTFGAAGTPLLENVPLEDTGGTGTAGSHWRRSVFGNELMNGYAGAGPQPLSLLTVMAMADMGYGVNTSAAESWGQLLFAAPNLSLGRLPDYIGLPAMALSERLTTPRFETDRAGRRRQVAPVPR